MENDSSSLKHTVGISIEVTYNLYISSGNMTVFGPIASSYPKTKQRLPYYFLTFTVIIYYCFFLIKSLTTLVSLIPNIYCFKSNCEWESLKFFLNGFVLIIGVHDSYWLLFVDLYPVPFLNLFIRESFHGIFWLFYRKDYIICE